jgi:hypothetical protein
VTNDLAFHVSCFTFLGSGLAAQISCLTFSVKLLPHRTKLHDMVPKLTSSMSCHLAPARPGFAEVRSSSTLSSQQPPARNNSAWSDEASGHSVQANFIQVISSCSGVTAGGQEMNSSRPAKSCTTSLWTMGNSRGTWADLVVGAWSHTPPVCYENCGSTKV